MAHAGRQGGWWVMALVFALVSGAWRSEAGRDSARVGDPPQASCAGSTGERAVGLTSGESDAEASPFFSRLWSTTVAEAAGEFARPSPQAWSHWWRSRQRPRSARRKVRLSGGTVDLITEALPPGWQYPVTAGELEAALRELPAAWTARLRSVRMTYRPEWGVHARTDRSQIQISYVVDGALRAPGEVSGASPEELQFGARLERGGERQHLVWPNRDALRTYLLSHILIHELGHHVAPSGLGREEEETWAEAFAYQFFTPPGATRLARSRR